MPNLELLMPAGDYEKMQYAYAFGADAVYLGIPRFSLRARENGFRDFAQVAQAVSYAHGLGKKIYVTANIFPHNSKLPSFTKHIADLLALCKPDAWIMSDPGLIMMMRETFPDETVHISVQSNTLNWASAKFWQKMGASRIIVSREISIKEIKEIHEACPDLELESFVHGAICMAYSGRCLISNYLSHRDSNQGVCTNSCRWDYKVYKKDETQQDAPPTPLKGQYFVKESERPDELFELDEDEHGSYLMNSKDLCAIHCLNELRDAGVCSFKVEGRSKSVYYAALIARAYRMAMNDLIEGRPFNPIHMKDIFATSNRGFIEGFLYGNPGTAGQEYITSNSKYSSHRFIAVVKGYDQEKQRLKLEMRNPMKKGQVLELCLPESNEIFTVKDIFDLKGSPVSQVHGGASHCWITFPKDPGPFAILREAINETNINQNE